MIKLLTFDNSLTHYDILVKRRSRMTTAITFSPGGAGGGGDEKSSSFLLLFTKAR